MPKKIEIREQSKHDGNIDKVSTSKADKYVSFVDESSTPNVHVTITYFHCVVFNDIIWYIISTCTFQIYLRSSVCFIFLCYIFWCLVIISLWNINEISIYFYTLYTGYGAPCHLSIVKHFVGSYSAMLYSTKIDISLGIFYALGEPDPLNSTTLKSEKQLPIANNDRALLLNVCLSTRW